MEIARLIAQGFSDPEIRSQMAISQPRLRVLKANPVIQQQIDRYRQQHEDSYRKALKKVEQQAEDVADRMLNLTNDISVPANVRFSVCKDLMDRLAQASGLSQERISRGNGSSEQVTFEQILRVTKKAQAREELDGDEDLAAIQELGADGEAEDLPVVPEDIKKVH